MKMKKIKDIKIYSHQLQGYWVYPFPLNVPPCYNKMYFYLLPCVPFTNRLTAEKDVTPDDSVSRVEHDTVREQLEGEVNHLTHLLQEALRKQDEMALEAADAWQKVGG